MITVESIRRDGQAMTVEYRDFICAKFRTEIGGLYGLIAACIERDHEAIS